ncbi:MAG: hypothetical protein WD467_01560 [Candidatus Saccharimonadales bacterium]
MMRRYYLLAAGLGLFFIALVVLQFILTIDVRHDQQIERDLTLIEEQLRLELEGEPEPEPTASLTVAPYSLAALDLPRAVEERVEANGYEVWPLLKDEAVDEYRIELCAVFRTDTTALADEQSHEYTFAYHPAGRACFERTIFLTEPVIR